MSWLSKSQSFCSLGCARRSNIGYEKSAPKASDAAATHHASPRLSLRHPLMAAPEGGALGLAEFIATEHIAGSVRAPQGQAPGRDRRPVRRPVHALFPNFFG